MSEETKKELLKVHETLQLIFVRGIDAVHMANALMQLEHVIQKEGENNDSN